MNQLAISSSDIMVRSRWFHQWLILNKLMELIGCKLSSHCQTSHCNTNQCEYKCESSAVLLRVACYFLLNLSGLQDSLSFLGGRGLGQWGGGLEKVLINGLLAAAYTCETHRAPEHPGHGPWRSTYLDNHHLNRDVVRQSDWGSEVLGQRHQQVEDGNNTLSMDGWRAEGNRRAEILFRNMSLGRSIFLDCELKG